MSQTPDAPRPDAETPPSPEPIAPAAPVAPLGSRPLVRVGTYAWSFVGIIVAAALVVVALGKLRILAVPLLLAVFPAALLAPLAARMRREGMPRAVAALLTLLLALLVVVGVVRFLAPAIAEEAPRLAESFQQGVTDLRDALTAEPFGLSPEGIDDAIAGARDALTASFQHSAVGIVTAVAEGVTGFLILLVVLFFYLKDGDRIATWLRDLFPERVRGDVAAIGSRTWTTFGAYFRGQLFVALVDAVFIGIGLLVLRVPLALPLAVLVFVGGLFPIIGAFISGTVAVLVALADRGLVIALLVLALVVVVQQVESNVLAPVVLGRATELHPLAVILSLAAGGVLLGVLGAFLAVPVAASAARGIGHLRARVPG